MKADPYDICRYVRHYFRKNDYPIRVGMLIGFNGLSAEQLQQMVANGVLALGGRDDAPLEVRDVSLTEKGLRMANAPPRIRGGRR